MTRTYRSPYFEQLEQKIAALGGCFNAHIHGDRAGTYAGTVALLSQQGIADGTSLSLAGKHALIPMVHSSPMFDPEALHRRVGAYLDTMVEVGTTRVDTVVDTTIDRVGRSAFDALSLLKQANANRIDFRLGAYSPLGFRDDEPQRWALLETVAEQADFIGLLPERDDRADYPDHIGFTESCRRGIALAARLGKQIHIHVDQSNHPDESGGELVAQLVEDMGLARPAPAEPFVWLIHLISPSTYPEPRFDALALRLAALGIGVITCPSGAISMRQLRRVSTPTFNSIARVLELLVAGVQVRIGSDNICDVTSPMGTPDLMDEVFVLANAIRYYDLDVLAHLAAGVPLGDDLRARITAHLAFDREAVETALTKIANRATFAKP